MILHPSIDRIILWSQPVNDFRKPVKTHIRNINVSL